MEIQGLSSQWKASRGGYSDSGELHGLRELACADLTWRHVYSPSFLRVFLYLSHNLGGSAGAASARAIFLVLLILLIEAGQKTRVSWGISGGFRQDQQRHLPEHGVRVRLQDSGGLGFAD